ncbi:hypothetical protein GHT06_008669 [Daphnia sinensis]|uniref:Uncharacterized protein n=1 Tax=Daphnia sinensis TaxID=1820382 RepID=A0AAD5Q0V9_9CRUS|nr:hypothetical protein GHT06_008669 [Daphnia sinensis]
MSTSGSMDDLGAIVTRLSKELELMGLPGLASQQQVDYNDGAMAVDVISDLISASYDLIGLLRDLQRSKRQREDHAQQLLHDLQRSQWLLDREKELSVQREREAAEAYEKERQANVRLQSSETLLKKKSEEHRQLAHECQLKENQWLHALRRRDQENHRLQQQLLKFLHSKSSGSGGGGIILPQVEIRGSLAARASSSDSTRLRKQWDRTADETRKHVEVKWKSALNSLEKDHQLLRVDYLQLVDTLGRFLTNCADKLGARRPANTIFFNVMEWIHLPVSSMRDRLEEALRLVECALVTPTISQTGQNFDPTDRRDEIEINPMTQQTEHAASGENRPTAVHTRIGPLAKDDVIISKSRTISPLLSSTQESPTQMAKCVRSEPVSAGHLDSPALRKPSKGSTKPPVAINQADWNQRKMDNPPLSTLSSRQDTVVLRQPAIGTEASFLVGSPCEIEGDEDRVDVHDEMATLDTPCPSASNSPSRSSTSSDSSWKSQRSEIDATSEIDEQFYRTCDAAAALVRHGRRPSNDPSICARKSGTTVNLNSGYVGSITAKVSVVQQRQAGRLVAPATSTYSVNPS